MLIWSPAPILGDATSLSVAPAMEDILQMGKEYTPEFNI